MRHMYVTKGLIDEDKIRAEAEKKLKEGEETTVHMHPYSVSCADAAIAEVIQEVTKQTRPAHAHNYYLKPDRLDGEEDDATEQ